MSPTVRVNDCPCSRPSALVGSVRRSGRRGHGHQRPITDNQLRGHRAGTSPASRPHKRIEARTSVLLPRRFCPPFTIGPKTLGEVVANFFEIGVESSFGKTAETQCDSAARIPAQGADHLQGGAERGRHAGIDGAVGGAFRRARRPPRARPRTHAFPCVCESVPFFFPLSSYRGVQGGKVLLSRFFFFRVMEGFHRSVLRAAGRNWLSAGTEVPCLVAREQYRPVCANTRNSRKRSRDFYSPNSRFRRRGLLPWRVFTEHDWLLSDHEKLREGGSCPRTSFRDGGRNHA